MATLEGTAAALKVLGRAFAGVVDKAKVDVYFAALEDLSDADLMHAVTVVVKTHTGEFIPPPAVLRKAVAPAAPVVDSAGLIRQIERLSHYSPAAGMSYPPVQVVYDRLGAQTAYAYAAAGGPRLFSENETTRDIAAREFAKACVEASTRPAEALPILDRPAGLPLLDDLVKRIGGPSA